MKYNIFSLPSYQPLICICMEFIFVFFFIFDLSRFVVSIRVVCVCRGKNFYAKYLLCSYIRKLPFICAVWCYFVLWPTFGSNEMWFNCDGCASIATVYTNMIRRKCVVVFFFKKVSSISFFLRKLFYFILFIFFSVATVAILLLYVY